MAASQSRGARAQEELDRRAHDELEVALLWSRRTGRLTVTVADVRTGDRFDIPLGAGDDPLDVFHHPFAYAAFRGIHYGGDCRATSGDAESDAARASTAATPLFDDV